MRVCIVMMCALLCAACATLGVRPGGHHIVKKGETLSTIAASRRVTVQELAEWNNLTNHNQLKVAQRLYIPSGKKTSKAFHKKPAARKITLDHSRFAWPLQGVLSSKFGIRNGRRHDGIDIAAKHGTPIMAAAGGTVAFEGRLSGYGKLLILRHSGGYYTAYAHNSRHLVKKGQKVKRGQRIAKVGNTGRSTGPHLHFEVRYKKQGARNPLFFLPPRNKHERTLAKQARAPSAAKKTPAKTTGRGKWKKFTPQSKRQAKVNKGFRRK